MPAKSNPFPLIGTELISGLSVIAAAKPASVDDLVSVIYRFIQPVYYPLIHPEPDSALVTEIRSVVYNVIIAYINNPRSALVMFGPRQCEIIESLLGYNDFTKVHGRSLIQRISETEDKIRHSGISEPAQEPLFVATMCGTAVYHYWFDRIIEAGEWSEWLKGSSEITPANISFWTTACMEGALIGAHATSSGKSYPVDDVTAGSMVSSLTGALAIGSGVVMFGWVPRLKG